MKDTTKRVAQKQETQDINMIITTFIFQDISSWIGEMSFGVGWGGGKESLK